MQVQQRHLPHLTARVVLAQLLRWGGAPRIKDAFENIRLWRCLPAAAAMRRAGGGGGGQISSRKCNAYATKHAVQMSM